MSTRKTLHLIAQAHLDPVWLWPWRDGAAEALTTMQSAIDRMREVPALKFSRSSAMTYRWVQEMDPRLFAEIRARVAEGRWEVVNGWIEQPDCNIPSAESFIRHALYGKGYFARDVGADVRVGYNVDSFGHPGGLPQLLAGCGYAYYVFMRPAPADLPLPVLFRWASPDGSRVLCWHIPGGYCQSPVATPDELEAAIRAAAEQFFQPGFDDAAFFLGIGNHGGGPTRAHLARVLELQRDATLPELRFSTLHDFFARIEATPAAADLPVVTGDFERTQTGCYAAHGEIKRLNRRAERALGRAETLATLAHLAQGRAYPGEALREAWWTALFNQFHDILAGTSVPSAYIDARDSLGGACDTGQRVTVEAVHALARRVDTAGAPAGVLFLLNALPWARVARVQLDTFVSPHGDTPITHLVAADGTRLPLQWCAAEAAFGPHLLDWRRLTATVALPPCGYRAFHLAGGAAPEAPAWSHGLRVDDDAPGIASLTTHDGHELLAGHTGFVVLADTSDTWGHGRYGVREEVGRPELLSTAIVEDGPVCRVVRQTLRWQASSLLLDIITYRELPAVELRIRVNWQERWQVLKLEIPTALQDVRVLAKMAGAISARTPDGEEQPCHDWVALEGTLDGATAALGVMNDGSYSYDALDGLLRLNIARSAPFAVHQPTQLRADSDNAFLDQGWQERRFWLVGAMGAATHLNLPRLAEEAQTPAEYLLDSAHPGDAPWEASLLAVEPASVTPTAIKAAEAGDGYIVRLQETAGQRARARLRIPPLDLDWQGDLAPWTIATLHVARDGDRWRVREVDMLERA